MTDFDRTRGGSKIGVLVILVILVIGGYTAWKFIDARIKTYEFEDGVLEVCKYGSGKTEKEIMAEVLQKAKEAGVDVKAEQVTIQKSGGKIHITASYVHDVNPPLFKYLMNVHVDKESPEW